TYPSTPPHLSLEHRLGMREFPTPIARGAAAAAADTARRLRGSPMIYDLVTAVTQYLEECPVPQHTDNDDRYHNRNASAAAGNDGASDDDDTDSDRDGGVGLRRPGANAAAAASAAAAVAVPRRSRTARSSWRHTIGLIGKPSAGKSTFFNCAARVPQLARVAAHPFTTIDPQRAPAYWQLPDDWVPLRMRRVAEAEAAAAAAAAAVAASAAAVRADATAVSPPPPLPPPAVRWLMPCWIKDVAGLVPGASDGRGRGNAFLNDLCDADVLVHVVDASGLSDDDGNILLAAAAGPNDLHGDATNANSHNDDPLHDVRWIHRELHAWIRGNLERKWGGVLKRPWRLPDMLAGYGAPAALVADALRAAGLDPPPAVATPQQARERWVWPRDADRVVDEFLKRRFPTLVVLNKADLPGAGDRIRRAQEVLAAGAASTTSGASALSSASSSSAPPPPPTVAAAAVPACAAAEAWLQRAAARGAVAYAPGDASFRLLPPAAATITVDSGENNDGHDKDRNDDDESEAERAARVLTALGDTGVLRALSAAVLLRPPLVAFPVADLESLAPVVVAVAKPPAPQPAQAAAAVYSPDARTLPRQAAPPPPSVARVAPGVAMRPGATVADLFAAVRPLVAAPGAHLVRAELASLFVGADEDDDRAGAAVGAVAGASVRHQPPQARVSRNAPRDALIERPHSAVARFWTTRRPRWQHRLTAADGEVTADAADKSH
ncbi:hypothetical protein HK405_012790, partial [Cladochytrium tenue]